MKDFSNMTIAQVERLAKKNREKAKREEKEGKRPQQSRPRVNLAEVATDPSQQQDSGIFQEMKKRHHS